MDRDCQRCPALGRSLFKTLDDSHFARISDICSTRSFAAGDMLCHGGDAAPTVYCLQTGTIKLTRTGECGDTQLIRLLKPGDVFGLVPVLGGDSHSTDATELSDGTLCTIPRDVINEVLRTSPDFAMAVLKHMSQELRKSEDFLMVMTQRPVRRRVADVLLLLHGHTIRGDDWDPMPGFQLKRREIAEMVGSTPESVSRMLAEFAEGGLIRLTRTELELLDPEGLQTVAREAGPPD